MSNETDKSQSKKRDSFIAGGSAVSGLAALIGASCCVLPLILVNLGVSTAIVSKLAFFARAQNYFTAIAVVLIISGFVAAFWKGRRPARLVLALLVVAAILTAASYVMPFYEGHILRWMTVR